ncbi:hypothetical protein [Nostoc sp.]|uniref:hypothetical protein n=1 Tax=Nostoc sp. TaxID=1180 RepID=UPI002FFC7CF1
MISRYRLCDRIVLIVGDVYNGLFGVAHFVNRIKLLVVGVFSPSATHITGGMRCDRTEPHNDALEWLQVTVLLIDEMIFASRKGAKRQRIYL